MTDSANAAATAAPAMTSGWRREAPALVGMGLLYLGSILLAMAFSATFIEQDIRAFEDPEDLTNPLLYLAFVVVFTVAILLIVKYLGRQWLKVIILAAVAMTIYYVAAPLTAELVGGLTPLIVGTVLAVGLTALLWVYPEWYIVDAAGVLVAAGAAGIFGISFGLLPSLLLLVAFAVYDAIAVYRTKHMLDLADNVLELRLPIMFVVPKTLSYSFLTETRRTRPEAGAEESGEAPAGGTSAAVAADRAADGAAPEGARDARVADDAEAGKAEADDEASDGHDAMFMGLGDAVIPGVLAVSSLSFLDAGVTFVGQPGNVVVAFAALAGSFVGFAVLMWAVMKGNAHAGLPLLNAGAIAGFLLALLPLYGLAPIWPF